MVRVNNHNSQNFAVQKSVTQGSLTHFDIQSIMTYIHDFEEKSKFEKAGFVFQFADGTTFISHGSTIVIYTAFHLLAVPRKG